MAKKSVIGYFANGRIVNPNVTLMEEKTKDEEGNMVTRYTLPVTDEVSYSGIPAKLNDGTDYCLVYKNKVTGELHFSEAEVVTFHPTFKKVARVDSDSEKEDDRTTTEKREELQLAFGGKRAKRAVTARRRNRASEEQIHGTMSLASADAALKTAADKDDTPGTSSTSGTPDPISTAVPPFNASAATAGEVYDIECFLSEEDMNAIEAPVKLFLSKSLEELRNDGHSPLVLETLAKVKGTPAGIRSKLAAFLFYMSGLVKVKQMIGTRAAKVNFASIPVNLVPEYLQQKISNEFLQRSGRGGRNLAVTAALRQKLLCHLFVMALLMNKLTLSLGRLVSEWDVTLQRLTDVARAVGAKVSASGDDKVAKLEGPPKASIRGSPKKRRK